MEFQHFTASAGCLTQSHSACLSRSLGFHRACSAERHGFEYFRHGTLSLLQPKYKNRKSFGFTVPRHPSEEFNAFLSDVVVTQPRGLERQILPDLGHVYEKLGVTFESSNYKELIRQFELMSLKHSQKAITEIKKIQALKRELINRMPRVN